MENKILYCVRPTIDNTVRCCCGSTWLYYLLLWILICINPYSSGLLHWHRGNWESRICSSASDDSMNRMNISYDCQTTAEAQSMNYIYNVLGNSVLIIRYVIYFVAWDYGISYWLNLRKFIFTFFILTLWSLLSLILKEICNASRKSK